MADYTIDEIIEGVVRRVQKNDPASTSLANTPTLHGPMAGGSSTSQYGIFADVARPDMYSAMTRPRSVTSIISFQRSRNTNELIDTFTGVTDVTGTNAEGFCGNPPSLTGQGKKAKRKFLFGDFFGKTDLVAGPLNGQFKDYSDIPRRILNAAPEDRNPFIPDLMYRLDDPQLQMGQVAYQMYLFGVQTERKTEHVLIQGTAGGASTTDGLGWFNQFDGLDEQVKTGYTDETTGVLVPSMDSIVTTWGAAVSGTVGGNNMVQEIADMVYASTQNAIDMEMPGVQWAFVMRREAFRSLTEYYACNYETYRCATGATAGAPLLQDAATVNSLRRSMQMGQYLLVEGVQYPVVFSEGIEQTRNETAVYESDILFVPYSWDGIPLLRFEAFPMDNPANQALRNMGGYNFDTINNGMYYVANRNNGNCVEMLFSMRGRLILETPWLAGRIDNVSYTYRAQTRNAFPSDTIFHRDGGVTYTT